MAGRSRPNRARKGQRHRVKAGKGGPVSFTFLKHPCGCHVEEARRQGWRTFTGDGDPDLHRSGRLKEAGGNSYITICTGLQQGSLQAKHYG